MNNLKIGLTYTFNEKNSITQIEILEAINNISQALEVKGYHVKKIDNIHDLISKINSLDVDIVFNISEGCTGRNREAQVPLLLEIKKIPYTGSDALTLSLAADKIMAKKCFIAHNIPTPAFANVDQLNNLSQQIKHLNFPLFVKPRWEGYSLGISPHSLTYDLKSLEEQITFIHNHMQQPALVEEFIRGSEYTIPIIGNNRPEVLPIMQIEILGKPLSGDDFQTFERRKDMKQILDYVKPKTTPETLLIKMKELAIQAYKALECRDFGRIDFRLSEGGEPFVLEVNPNASLYPLDAFAISAQSIGMDYAGLIQRILQEGLNRHN